MQLERGASWRRCPSRETAAYRMLVTEIGRRGLKLGDKLPPQSEMRMTTPFSNSSLSRAMEKLVADGVVTRRSRVGTVVLDPRAVDLSAWTVALLMNWGLGAPPPPFSAQVMCMLQHGLMSMGCRCRAYPRLRHVEGVTERLSDYLNLQEDVDAGVVDAVFVLGDLNEEDRCALVARGIPVCFSTSWELAPCGVIVDNKTFGCEAVKELAACGRRRFCVVEASGVKGSHRLSAGVRTAVAAVAGGVCERIETNTSGLPGGLRAAADLLVRPKRQRPDSLIVADDYIALSLTQALRSGSDYVPDLAVATHQAMPLSFALPVRRFDLDDVRFAETSVQMLIERLLKPALPDWVEWIAPHRVDEGQRGTLREDAGTKGTNGSNTHQMKQTTEDENRKGDK